MGFGRNSAFALISAALLGGLPLGALAQDAPAAAVGEVPVLIPTVAFADRSQFSSAQLSPDGNRFALTIRRDDRVYVNIHDSETLAVVRTFALGDAEEFRSFRWVGNGQLLVTFTGMDLRYNARFSRLVAFDTATGTPRPLTLPVMGFEGDNVAHVDHEQPAVVVAIAQGFGNAPDVWRFDLAPDDDDEIRGERVENRQNRIHLWLADETGAVRIGVGYYGHDRYLMLYRDNEDAAWQNVAQVKYDGEDSLQHWDFMGLRSGSSMGYSIAVPEGGDRRVLMEFDFATGTPGQVIYASDSEDVSSVTFDEDNNPIAVSYSGEQTRREWLDPEIRRWREQLAAALPGSRVEILDIANDRSRLLVRQSGPSDPGALYVFTPASRNLQLFAEYRPDVPADILSEVRSIRYDARDGNSIHGWLTLPRGREPRGLPLVVHPHGGPYGYWDGDDYSDMVQLLANRGYAVVQPNFRGSGGYGEAFELLGHGGIGRAMQDDLDDAVAYLVAEGIVDPQRVCIAGSSYGGYAAVWGAIRNPEIYACAISFAGVMHFERQLAHDSDYLYGRGRRSHWNRVEGEQSDFDLDDVSPAVQVARLTRPVLLVHGKDDSRVPFSQFEVMVSRARGADVPLETLVLDDVGHGFAEPEDEQAYYDAVVDFLARHNPAD